mgnify:CR=1 FL=1
MSVFQWNDDLSVNSSVIDAQHKILIELINKLHDAMRDGKSNQVVGSIVKELADYTVYHFSEEEKLMQKAGYSDFAAHKREHTAFVEKVKEYEQKIAEGKLLLLGVNLSSFLKDWLFNHIKVVDKKYVNAITGK